MKNSRVDPCHKIIINFRLIGYSLFIKKLMIGLLGGGGAKRGVAERASRK